MPIGTKRTCRNIALMSVGKRTSESDAAMSANDPERTYVHSKSRTAASPNLMLANRLCCLSG
jgi:hypothetical protein